MTREGGEEPLSSTLSLAVKLLRWWNRTCYETSELFRSWRVWLVWMVHSHCWRWRVWGTWARVSCSPAGGSHESCDRCRSGQSEESPGPGLWPLPALSETATFPLGWWRPLSPPECGRKMLVWTSHWTREGQRPGESFSGQDQCLIRARPGGRVLRHILR